MLELMGSKNLQENLEVVRMTAEHKFNVFRIHPSVFTPSCEAFYLLHFSIDCQLFILPRHFPAAGFW